MGRALSEIAAYLDGVVVGDGSIAISGSAPLKDAVAGDLTLLDSSRNISKLQETAASAVVVSNAYDELKIPQVVVKDAHQAFAMAIALFRPVLDKPSPGIHRLALVDPTATIGNGTWIAEGSSIGRHCQLGERVRIHRGVHVMDYAKIGDDCELYPGVVVYHDCRIGNRVLIHAAAVIGAYGFGYRQVKGRHERTAQLGYVRIDDDVEIGAGTTIDRGTYGATSIGEGTKIDNQVMIGHNCDIGKHNLICAQVGIAGSSKTGDYVVLAGQVGVRDHVALGDRVMVGAQSGVANDLDSDQVFIGSPAIPQKKFMQQYMMLHRLPQIKEQIQELQEAINALQTKLESSSASEDNRRVA